MSWGSGSPRLNRATASPVTAQIRTGSTIGVTGSWTCPDLSDFQQFEAESLDLSENAEQRGPILKPTGEHGLAAHHLIRHRRKSRQGGGSEPTLDPDRVQARPGGHALMLPPNRVSRLRRNPVIAPP